MNIRINKINKIIRQNLNDILLKELSLKEGVFITLTKIDTSRDLHYTHVFVSIFPEKETQYAIKTLEKELFKIQGSLNKKLSRQPLPRISFKIDTTELHADKIEKLLKKI